MKAPEHRHWLQIAKSLAQKGHGDRAIGIWIRVAKFYSEQKKYSKAVLLVRRATHERKTRRVSAWARLIWLEAMMGHTEKAVHYTHLTAKLIARKRRTAAALDVMDRMLASFPACREEMYLGLLQLDRTTARFFVRAAQAMMEQRKFKLAKEMLLRGAATKTDGKEVAHLLAQALGALGETSQVTHVRRWVKAEISAEDLAVLLEKKEQPMSQESEAAPEPQPAESDKPTRGELKELIEALEQELGIAADPDYEDLTPLTKEFRERARPILASHSKTRVDLATAFAEMGMFHHAIEELDALRDTDPHYLEAQALKARFLYDEGSYLKALEVLQRSLRSDQAAEGIWTELNYQLIHVYRQLGDLPKAWEVLQVIERKTPLYRDLRFLKRDLAAAIELKKKEKAS